MLGLRPISSRPWNSPLYYGVEAHSATVQTTPSHLARSDARPSYSGAPELLPGKNARPTAPTALSLGG